MTENDTTVYRHPLYGKNWYVIGDSASEGDFTSIDQPPLQSGPYAGRNPVYPYYIGNRTGCVVHNLAVCGAVIATIPGQTRRQFSADGVYDTIVGDDADIITIWLGANDMWQNVPVGTPDSDDATTFWGAWNKLLTYYISRFPCAKLGIVASFWCTQPYAETVIAAGRKYGVPVLNFYNDPGVPVSVGSMRPDVDSAVKELRNRQWTVSPTNSHPSAAYHELESHFIEQWLMTL